MIKIVRWHICRVFLLTVLLMLSSSSIYAQEREESVLLRANILRWATLTPDIGVEWQLNKEWSVLASQKPRLVVGVLGLNKNSRLINLYQILDNRFRAFSL